MLLFIEWEKSDKKVVTLGTEYEKITACLISPENQGHNKSMKTTLSYLFTLLLIAQPLYAGVGKIDKLWNKRSVTVCFASKDHKKTTMEYGENGEIKPIAAKVFGPWEKELQEKVKNWINTEYTIERTGISFVGWSECSEGIKTEDIAIYLSSNKKSNVPSSMSQHGMASIGKNGHIDVDTNKKAFAYFLHPDLVREDMKEKVSAKNSELVFKQNIIHEFGHLAGLMHEHERDELAGDRDCQKILSDDIFNSYVQASIYSPLIEISEMKNYQGLDYVPGVKLTKYDSYSIMNYCMVERLRQNPTTTKNGLSDLDLKALKKMYK